MPSTVNISKHVALCKKQGFARIPNQFSQDEVNRLRANAIIAVAETQAGNEAELQIRHGYPTLLFFPKNDYLQQLSKDERLLNVVREYYGHDNFELETQQYYFHLPGDPDEFAWHTDERFRPGVKNRYLQTAIVVDDWTADNSAVEFIEGSHKQPFENGQELRQFVRGGRKGKRLLAKAGDILTWSNTVVHGSERNVGTTPRQYYMNGFRSNDTAEC